MVVRGLTPDALDVAVRRTRAAASVRGVVLIGVDGPSGAGESTVARSLGTAPIVPIDDFLSWHEYELWWPYFAATVLDPLETGREVRYHPRDWDGDEFGDALLLAERSVPRASVVVVEGVSGTRRAGADRYALRLWVEAPDGLRLQRGVERDGEDHRALWVEALERDRAFFDADGAAGRAHLVVDGTTGALLLERP